MGLVKKAAKASGRAAVNKARTKSPGYCPMYGKHRWGRVDIGKDWALGCKCGRMKLWLPANARNARVTDAGSVTVPAA